MKIADVKNLNVGDKLKISEKYVDDAIQRAKSMNIKEELQKIIDRLKSFYMLLRSDAAVRTEVRILAMGVFCCGVVVYGGNAALVEPKKKAIKKNLVELAAQVESSPEVDLLLTGSAAKLEKEKQDLQERKEILSIKERVLREHWKELADPETFTQIILTLLPGAPVCVSFSTRRFVLGG